MGDSGSVDSYLGMWIDAPHTTITYNNLTNVGYMPIAYYQNGSYTLIQYNYINTFCYIKDDGGGIYTWTQDTNPPQNGTVFQVRNNIILNGIGDLGLG